MINEYDEEEEMYDDEMTSNGTFNFKPISVSKLAYQ